ncbi:MAG TPA: TonB family protein [Thermoanaerobaculia bacterium]|nr:TonB family protein [Thermoanaerobaculia bacterium]
MESDRHDRWRRVQELFEAAADLRPGQQAAYLAAACGGDDGLRQEVEALLRSDAEAGSFIEHAIRRSSDLLLAAEPDPLEAIGKIGKYEILGRIGEGGFGIVYKGRDAVLQRYVAVKTCSSSDEKLRRRFFREGQIAAGLQHPNITTVYDLGVERGIPYLVQEFLAGEDLNHKIARQEDLTTLRRLDILVQVARGLEYAHLQGVLHRDVKPANIRVLPPGAVKIMDFGIAKLLHEVSDVTTQGVTIGTVGYLAPEQLRGEEVDRRTDVFSFGVLLYELLTYRRPFPGSTFSEVSYRLLNEEPAALSDLAPVHGRAIAELARRCLAKDPANRCQSFAEVVAVLEPELAALRSGPLPVMAATGGPAAASDTVGAGAAVTDGAEPGAGAGPAPGGEGGRRRRHMVRRAWLGAAVVALAVSLGAAGWAVLRLQAPGSPAEALRAGDRSMGAAAMEAGAGRDEERTGRPAPVGADAAAGNGEGRQAGRGMAQEAPPAGLDRSHAGEGAAAPGAPRLPASPRAAPAREEHPPAAPAPRPLIGSRRVVPPASRPGGGTASGVGGEAAARGDGGATEPGQEGGGIRADRPPAAPASAAAGAGPAEGSEGGGGPAEESRRGPSAAGSGAGEGAGEAGVPSRAMVRGDLIPPGAPHATPPRLLSRPEPQYPDRARRRQAESDVLMLVLVDENGRVLRAIVKRTDDPGLGFNEAARHAALRATFNPASRDGLPGKMWTELPFSFRLRPGE